jgi:hypothetical protein
MLMDFRANGKLLRLTSGLHAPLLHRREGGNIGGEGMVQSKSPQSHVETDLIAYFQPAAQ